jgi:hypothetical protein
MMPPADADLSVGPGSAGASPALDTSLTPNLRQIFSERLHRHPEQDNWISASISSFTN